MIQAALGVLLCSAIVCAAPPVLGPYATNASVYAIDTLDSSDPRVWVWYPANASSGAKFPLVPYLHGMAGGGLALLGYAELFSQMASYGFIVIGTYSCGLGCVDAHKLSNARWLCGGLPPLAPLNMGWDAYYAEGAKTGARRARTPVKSPLPSHPLLLAPPLPFQPSRSLTGPKTTAQTPQTHCSP